MTYNEETITWIKQIEELTTLAIEQSNNEETFIKKCYELIEEENKRINELQKKINELQKKINSLRCTPLQKNQKKLEEEKLLNKQLLNKQLLNKQLLNKQLQRKYPEKLEISNQQKFTNTYYYIRKEENYKVVSK
jgi:TolA-binding protein